MRGQSQGPGHQEKPQKVSALKAVSEFYVSQRMTELTVQHAEVFQILSVALNYGYTGYGTLKL